MDWCKGYFYKTGIYHRDNWTGSATVFEGRKITNGIIDVFVDMNLKIIFYRGEGVDYAVQFPLGIDDSQKSSIRPFISIYHASTTIEIL